MTWRSQAYETIMKVHGTLPVMISLEDRTAAIDAAYPFGERANFPYKAWLQARKGYLSKYGYRVRQEKHLSPLERAMQKAQR